MLLSRALLGYLAIERSVVFVLDPELRVARVNDAWSVQAGEQGVHPGEPETLIGRSYLDFVVGPLQDILRAKFQLALDTSPATSGPARLLIPSECNTPTHYRTLTTHVIPVASSTQMKAEGLLVIHSLHVVGLLGERYPLSPESPELLRDAAGILVQCSVCRRVRDPDDLSWVMSEALVVRSFPDTSHTLCEVCVEAYYPDADGLTI